MGLAYKQLMKQITSNKIFVALLLLLTMITSLSFFFVKFSIDRNMEVLNTLTSLTEKQELYKAALHSNTSLAYMFLIALTSFTAFVYMMFFYRFFRESSKHIGCLKLLGFRDSILCLFFVSFTAVLSLVGSLLGVAGGYFLSSILIQANTNTYDVTGLVKGLNLQSVLLGIIVTTIVFCLVTYFSFYLIKGKEVGTLLSGKQSKKKSYHTLKIVNYIVRILPEKSQFSLRIALRKPIAALMILIAVMTFTVCIILGYSLNRSSKVIFDSQMSGHYYNYDSHFTDYQVGVPSTDEITYLDCYATFFSGNQEVKQTVVGFYHLNYLYQLQSDKEHQLGIPNKGEIYVNPGLAETYGVAVGDVLTLDISGSSYHFNVTGIVENAKSACVYVNVEDLVKILNIPNETYNGLLSREEIFDSDEMISREEKIENLNRNAVSYKVNGVLDQVIGCITGAILIFISLLINFQDNTKDFLILSMIGYQIKEIKKLLVDVYLPIIIFSFALTILPSIMTAKAIQKSFSITTGEYMPFGTNIVVFVIAFILLNIIYWIVQSFFVIGIKNVIAKEEISEYANY